MAFARAFLTGFRTALGRWPAVIGAFAAVGATALAAAILPGVALLAPARWTAIREAANGVDAWMVLEQLFNSGRSGVASGGPAPFAGFVMLISLILIAALPLLAWLVNSFLLGGVITALIHPADEPAWRSFWQGCRRWFGPFLLVGLLQALAVLLLVIAAAVVFALLNSVLPGAVLWALAVLPLLAFTLMLAFFEMSRVQMARRGAFGAGMSQAFRWLSHPLDWIGFYLLSLALLAVVAVLFNLAIFPALPLEIWPLAFVVEEVFIFIRAFLLAVRYGGLAQFRVS